MHVVAPTSRLGCRLRHLAGVLLVVGMLLARVAAAEAESVPPSREDQFKAAYLLNFVKFVEWPAATTQDAGQLTICLLGGEGIYRALASTIEGKRVGQRALAVRRISGSDTFAGCNAVYFDAAAQVLEHLESLHELPVLTVSDAGEFTSKHGMIGLFLENNRLRFNINVDNAQKCGLRIRSSLLQLAAAVERNP